MVTKNDLRRETRDWRKRGVVPAAAAEWRRHAATFMATEEARENHLAFAAEWDRIAAKEASK